MKILQVVPFFSPVHGGSAIAPYYISRELAKRGHEVTIFTSDYKLSREWVQSLRQVKVYPFKTRLSWAKFYVTPNIMKHSREKIKHLDLIHMHNYRSFQNIIVHHYAKKYGVPYVLQAHGSLPRIMVKQRLKWIYDVFFGYRLLRDASKVIALSQMEAQQYRSMDVPEEKIEVIPNGIDLSEFGDLPPKGSFKKKFSIGDDEKIVLYLGRIYKLKGIDFLIKAYAHLVKNMKFNDVLLVMVGPDDGYLSEAGSLVGSLGVSGKVLFTGLLAGSEKVSAFVDSSLVVYPCPVESFGLVTLEAAASGKPVIVSNNTPMATIIKKGKFGFSVKYGDIDELAEIMGKMLNNDELLREMGQKGRKFIFGNCDWSNIVTKLKKVYEEILSCSSQLGI
jgi:glycosyltransferase involved in cell wall biosynthesis